MATGAFRIPRNTRANINAKRAAGTMELGHVHIGSDDGKVGVSIAPDAYRLLALLDANEKIPVANLPAADGDTLKIGDLLISARVTPPAGYLKADGLKYLKSAYPAYGAAAKPIDHMQNRVQTTYSGHGSETVSAAILAGNLAVFVSSTNIIRYDFTTGSLLPALLTGQSSNFSNIRLFLNPADGLLYILQGYSGTFVVKTLNLSTGAVATVANNLAAIGMASSVLSFIRANNKWIVKNVSGVKYAVGNTLNSMVAVAAGNAIEYGPIPDDLGNLWAISGSGTDPRVVKSTDATTFTDVGSAHGGHASAPRTINSSTFDPPNRLIVNFAGRIYYLLTASQVPVFLFSIIPENNAVEYVAETTSTNANPGSYGKMAVYRDFLAALSPQAQDDSSISIDSSRRRITTSDITNVFDSPLTLASYLGDGRAVWHPDYGFVFVSSANTLYTFALSFNRATEFRTPKLPTEPGISKYVKAA